MPGVPVKIYREPSGLAGRIQGKTQGVVVREQEKIGLLADDENLRGKEIDDSCRNPCDAIGHQFLVTPKEATNTIR